jgi:hypothetical protein
LGQRHPRRRRCGHAWRKREDGVHEHKVVGGVGGVGAEDELVRGGGEQNSDGSHWTVSKANSSGWEITRSWCTGDDEGNLRGLFAKQHDLAAGPT